MKIYKKGQIVTGEVTGIEQYGIFLKIDEEHNGLIHISEISDFYVRNIEEYAKVGENIKAIVLEDNENSAKVKLSIKNIDRTNQINEDRKIQETSSGFNTLRVLLDVWINDKLKQKIKKEEKN